MNRLGKDYGEFDVAYHFLRENTPILGIINFDPEHATVDDKTIYDYVADLPRNRNQSVDTVIKRLSPALVPSMRALLIRAETTLLGYQPIIPSELAGELDLVLGNVQLMGAKPDDQELDEVALTLDAIDEKTLAELTPSLIMSIRETDEARCFWEIVECSSQKEASLSEIREAAAQYVRRISMDVTRDTWSRGNRKTESVIVRVLRHTLSTSKQNAEVVIGTSIQLGGLLYAPLVVLAPIGQAVAKLLNKSADGETATSSPVVGANLSVSQSTLGRATQHTQ
ncbi:hypothetical protein [Methylomonas sp. AM2-LC]|uniref:hypothetical protein n=1 Tax=Methylomonas sp. AM2-LC TaxID=3153301 RepID=UPI0032666F8E